MKALLVTLFVLRIVVLRIRYKQSVTSNAKEIS